MNFSQAVAYLDTLHKDRDVWDLEPIKKLLAHLDNPEKGIKCIHVTGTNGKGSVCAFTHAILMNAGFKTGLYISPHLRKITERIKINNEEIAKEEFTNIVKRIKPYVTGQSYFEVLTAMAFLYFKEQEVDYAVIEVGLGGRIDATNVCNSLVSVITNVGLEHTHHLGNTISKIAREKAGIIHEHTYCVTAATGEALDEIQKICAERNTQLYSAQPTGLKLGLPGEFQKSNAGIAIKVIKLLKKYGIVISKKNIIDGLAQAQWPGRLQWLQSNLLIDCAHNPHGMAVLVEELRRITQEKKFKKTFLIFGVLADKDYREMADLISPWGDEIILTKPNSHRALDPKVLQKLIPKKTTVIENVNTALRHAQATARQDTLILVTGSIYLIGDIEEEFWQKKY